MLMMLALILLAAVLGTVRPRAGLVAGLLVLGLSLLGTFVLSSDPWTEVSSWLDWRGAASAAAGGSYSAMLGLTLVCVSLAPRARRWWLTRRRGQEPLRAEEESRPVATSRT
ncbi:hypothetical protein ACQBAU_09235 [Propionibacteriaceae bacterium Y2011]